MLNIEDETKWPPFLTQFQIHFLNDSCRILVLISLKFIPEGPSNNRRQAVVWINDGQV